MSTFRLRAKTTTMGIRSCLVFLMSTSLTSVLAKNLPSHVHICARNSYHFGDCIKNATVILQPYLAQGIPELNIPSIEPLKAPVLFLQQVTSGVNYRNILSDVKVYGLSNYKFNAVRGDITKGRIEGELDLPWLRIESRYNISGTVKCQAIEGSGFFKSNITKTKGEVVLRGHLLERRGIKYYENTDASVKLNIGGAMMNFENLFKSDPNTTMATNMFLNENSIEIIKDVRPALEKIAGMMVNDIANKVFLSVPYDKLFPKI